MFPSFTSRDVLLWFQVLHDFLLLLVTIPTLLLNEASSFDEQCHRTGQMLYSFCWVFACRHLHYILYLQKLSKVWFYTLKWRLCNVVRDRERGAKLRAIQTHMHLQMCCPRTTYKCQWPLDASTCSQVMLPTCGLQALFLLLVGFVVGWFCCWLVLLSESRFHCRLEQVGQPNQSHHALFKHGAQSQQLVTFNWYGAYWSNGSKDVLKLGRGILNTA